MWHNYFKPILFTLVLCVWSCTLVITSHGATHTTQATPAKTVTFLPHPKRVGIAFPLLIKASPSVSRQSLYHDITIKPPENFTIAPLGHHVFAVRPMTFWSDATTIRCVTHDLASPEETTWHTDDGKILLVNLSTQTMEAYEDGILVRVMPVSTGTAPNWTTPTGSFYIYRRVKDDHMRGGTPGTKDYWNVRHVPYAQYIYQGIAIHGAWWNHHFGTPRSHGCIQLSTRFRHPQPDSIVDNAQWAWEFADLGTPVKVFGKTPLSAQKPLSYPVESA